MARDITVHFVGNARDLAASSAVAGESVERLGHKAAVAGAEAEAASAGFDSMMAPLIAIAAALVGATLPITALATTFSILAAGVVGLPLLMGLLGDEVKDLLSDLRIMALVIGTEAAPMAREFLAMLTPLIPVITQMGLELLQWFGERLPAMLPIMTQMLLLVVGAVIALLQAWGHLIDWFMAHWPAYQKAIGDIFMQIGSGVNFALPLLGLVREAFIALGPVFTFIHDHGGTVLRALGVLFVVMAASAMLTVASIILVTAAVVAVAAAIEQVIHWIEQAVRWFGSLIDKAGGAANAIRAIGTAVENLPGIGGAIGSILEHRQFGGPLLPGGIYTVGEGGIPETVVMGATGGYVIPGRASGGGVTNHYTITVSAAAASPADVGRQVVQAIQEYERRGSKGWRT